MSLRFGAFTLDVQARQLARGGVPLHLSPKAFDLLSLLIEERPAVVEKGAIRQRLWPDVHVVDAALTNLVAEIRAELRDGKADSTFVRTVHGIGYAFAGDVTEDAGVREPEPPRAAPFWLVWNDRPVVLAARDHVVGRDAACDVWVEADGVSRRHARIRVPAGAGAPTIEDLDSTNGTYVQGRRVTDSTSLKDGDRIRMGHATLVFRARDALNAPTKRVKGSRRSHT